MPVRAQLYSDSQIWDTHDHLKSEIQKACDRTDKPVAALLKDLKAGCSTVSWYCGEASSGAHRSPSSAEDESVTSGRDHNKDAFSCWLAGAGIKAGTIHGTTDEIGLMIENRVSVTGLARRSCIFSE